MHFFRLRFSGLNESVGGIRISNNVALPLDKIINLEVGNNAVVCCAGCGLVGL